MAACLVFGGSHATQDAIANGDTRTIDILHMHTKERVSVTYKRSGRYDPRGLEQLNWVLRDWRRDEATKMDPRLFDVVWEAHRSSGSRQPVHVVSAYRAPATNAMLRRRSSAVARLSQHTLGKAMDFYLPDVPVARVRALGMRMQRGGVGYYPSSNTPFIHLDVGSVRAWPRMTRNQLVQLFPDGRTVHIPADGKPLPGFEAARAQILAAGGTVSGYRGGGEDAGETPNRRRSLWATLFGGADEEDDLAESEATRGTRTVARAPSVASTASYGAGNANSDVYAALIPQAAPAAAPAPARTARPAREAAPVVVAAATVQTPPRAAAAPAPLAKTAPLAETPARPAVVAAAPATVQVPLPVPRPATTSAPIVVAQAAAPPPAPIRTTSVQPASAQPREAPALAAAPAVEAGPRLVWQQGPAAIAAAPAPVPPRRPDASVQIAVAPAPAPAATPAPAASPLGPNVLAYAAVPPPPNRPDALTALGITARGSRAANAPAAEAPRPRPALRSTVAALPSGTPDTVGALSAAQRQARAPSTAEIERAALRALFSTVATAPAARGATIRIASARPAPQAPALAAAVAVPDAGLQLGFSDAPQADLVTARFTGPAVKPLPLRR